jgi:hypothetical protein
MPSLRSKMPVTMVATTAAPGAVAMLDGELPAGIP